MKPEIDPYDLVDEILDLIDDRHRLDWLIESAKIDLCDDVGHFVMTYTREHIDQAMEEEDDETSEYLIKNGIPSNDISTTE